MKQKRLDRPDKLPETRKAIEGALKKDGVVILPPLDVSDSIDIVAAAGFAVECTMLDPWYNKGVGGVRADYNEFISQLLASAAQISEHVYLWGFPEIVATFVAGVPSDMKLTWLTWYYKNNPSVIRGWRSSQMACLHLRNPDAKLHPEHFLNEAQKEKQREGKLRYIPGPTSVIEEPLLVGFVGKKEQTGHPAQKPFKVFEKMILMATLEGELVLDPLSGSGTTGAVAKELGRKAILCDSSEEYTRIAEERLGVQRLDLPADAMELVDPASSLAG